MIRSIEQIINQMREELKSENSELAQFPKYGNLYTIYKAISSLVQEQDNKISNLNNNLYLSTATGEYLDAKGLENGFKRSLGIKARGTAFTLSNKSLTLKKGTVLTNYQNNTQYVVTNDIYITANVRTLIEIESLLPSREGNILAGSVLKSEGFINVDFVIGSSYNTLSNTYIGNISNGQDIETDEEFRSRILNKLNNLNSNSTAVYTDLISIKYGIPIYSIKENTPGLGYVTIYVSETNTNTLNSLKKEINLIKPLGINILLKSYNLNTVDISIVVRTLLTNIQTLENNINIQINNIFNSVYITEGITKEELASKILIINGVDNVRIISPVRDLPKEEGKIYTLGNLSILYE